MLGESWVLWKKYGKIYLGYEGYYQVSNFGRIKSLKFRNGIIQKSKERIMQPTNNGKGYQIIGLRKPSQKKKNFYVHRLVAIAFIDNPNNYNIINHKDYNRANNNVDNLEWCTQSYNARYSLIHRLYINCKPVAKISPASNMIIETYKSIQQASNENNVSTTYISYCCKGKYKTAKGYIWEFLFT